MKNIFMKINIVFILFFFVLFLSSCLKSTETNIKTVKLNEVTRSIFYAPQYVALSRGYFLEEGLDIKLVSAEGSDKTMTAILSGQADIGLLGTSAVISVYSGGKEDFPILFAGITQKDGSFLVGRTHEFNWKELNGKEIIAGRKGGVPEMVLEHILLKRGLNIESDVKLLNNIQFNLMSVAFGRGVGDYVTLFEPTASLLVKEKNFYILKSLGSECDKLAYTGYCCSQNYMNKNSEIIKKFTQALYKSQVWIKNHEASEIAQVVAPYFVDSDIDLLTDCIENYLKYDVWCDSPVIPSESFDLMQEIMIAAHELEDKVEFDDIVYDEYAREIAESIVH